MTISFEEEVDNQTAGLIRRELDLFLRGGWSETDPDLGNEIGKRVASAIHCAQHNMRCRIGCGVEKN